MTFSKRLTVGLAAAGLTVGLVAAPASAHKREITQVYGTTWDDGTVHTQVWLSTETHSGTVKTTLKKKTAAGDWVSIATKKATYALGWGYAVNFSPVAGDKTCKAVGKHIASDHPTLTKTSPTFAC